MLPEMGLEDAEALRQINADQLGYDIPLTVTVRQMKTLLKEPQKNFFLVYEDPTYK
ncbi:GNAT family N-acetyltransferase, partial [Enterococcus faecium]